MKVIADKIGSVTTLTRTLELQDGPVISPGDDYTEVYFRVEEIQIKWIEGQPAKTVSLFGQRTEKDGTIVLSAKFTSHPFRLNIPVDRDKNMNGLPQWLYDFAVQHHFFI